MTVPTAKNLWFFFRKEFDPHFLTPAALGIQQRGPRSLTSEEVSPGVLQELARRLRNPRGRRDVDELLELFNKAIRGHGIEAINAGGWEDSYYGSIVALYVNMGDTYTLTLLYEIGKGKFRLTSWGDWVEANERRLGPFH